MKREAVILVLSFLVNPIQSSANKVFEDFLAEKGTVAADWAPTFWGKSFSLQYAKVMYSFISLGAGYEYGTSFFDIPAGDNSFFFGIFDYHLDESYEATFSVKRWDFMLLFHIPQKKDFKAFNTWGIGFAPYRIDYLASLTDSLGQRFENEDQRTGTGIPLYVSMFEYQLPKPRGLFFSFGLKAMWLKEEIPATLNFSDGSQVVSKVLIDTGIPQKKSGFYPELFFKAGYTIR